MATVKFFGTPAMTVGELPQVGAKAVVCVSADLPFAAKRFCTINGIENVTTGSAFRSAFGKKYGVEFADGVFRGLMARSVVVIDTDGTVLGSQFVDEQSHEPDYAFVENLLK